MIFFSILSHCTWYPTSFKFNNIYHTSVLQISIDISSVAFLDGHLVGALAKQEQTERRGEAGKEGREGGREREEEGGERRGEEGGRRGHFDKFIQSVCKYF